MRRSPTAVVLLLTLAPGLLLAGFAALWYAGLTSPPEARALGGRAARLERWLDGELAHALAITEAFRDGRPLPLPRTGIAARLEGVGLLDADLNYLSWRGTPPEPRSPRSSSSLPSWQVVRSGVHTRLLVRAGPDREGRSALASFVVDSRIESLAASRWIPRALIAGIDLDLRLGEAPGAVGATVWSAPDGTPIAAATLRPVSREHAAARAAHQARAWAALLAAVLALACVPWRSGTRSAAAWGVTAIAAARLLLLATRAPAWILSPELGTAKLFGSSTGWGLVASPADLALTALAVYGLAHWVASTVEASAESGRTRAATLSAAAAASGCGCALWLLSSVARGSSVPLLGTSPFWRSPGRFVVAVSLVVALLAVADLLEQALGLARRGRGRQRFRVGSAVLTLGFVIATSLWLAHGDARAARDRLQSEYAALVLDPLPARKLALTSALTRVRERLASGGTALAGVDAERLAYELWVESELFFGGHRSSLDLYDAQGALVSHFGFDLPLLVEDEEPQDPPDDPVRIRENETFRPVAALRQRLLHGAVRIGPGGEAGWVVGHVLDEPTNLAFLPGSRTYLAALGAGAPFSGTRAPDDVEYVLYDASGTVVLSTLLQPPAMTDVLVQALEHEGRIDVLAGDERWAGLALQDAENRLHALVVPSPGLLARLAAATRLALVAAALVAAREVVRGARGPSRWRGLLGSLRGSFYRKLLAALLVASTVPLFGLALVVQGYIDRRGRSALVDSATQYARAAQRVLDDYLAVGRGGGTASPAPLNDEIVYWLRNINGQEIHVYDNALLEATSRRELFAAGVVPPRLDGEVHHRLGKQGSPYVVVPARVGASSVPVAYAPIDHPDPQRSLVAAVPVVTEAQVIARSVERVADTILLATVLLASLLAVVAAYVARTVARPVRELVGATARIARGDYSTRLHARTSDEVAELVGGFNSMAASLATQRADLERRREYTERLLEHATTGVISLDPTGSIVTLNPAARRLFDGTAVHPRVGDPLERALGGGPALEPLRRLFARPSRTAGLPEEVDLAASGTSRRLRVVRVPLADPLAGSIGTLVLLDDVTDLMRSNQLAAWAEMARAIAHEIKNPLTPIQLSTEHLERLLRDRGVLPAADLEACIETVKKQVRALYEIAGEFSAYAKLPALDPRPLDPIAFLREVVSPYRSAGLRGVEIEERYAQAGPVAIDARVLGRAIVNLIENALQAMPEGGRLILAVEPDAETDGVALTVSDTGSGITPEVRRRLFEPYFSTKSSGTGLGLAIVRRAVEAHGGRIDVEATAGRGTTFRIRLPRSATG